MKIEEAESLRIGDPMRVEMGERISSGRLESLQWNGITWTAMVRVSGRVHFFDISRIRKENRP